MKILEQVVHIPVISMLNNKTFDDEEEPSDHGHFVWTAVGRICVPCLLNNDKTKYISVRMAETSLLSQVFTRLNPEVLKCIKIEHFPVTETKVELLNEINAKHCEYTYGKEPFTMDDALIILENFIELYKFMETCYKKLTNQIPVGSKCRCGFLRINDSSVVPYTMKDDQQYVPLFYFEGNIESLETKAINLTSWDLAYLKFCCKIQGVKNELFASEDCLVTSLENLKSYLPDGSTFEEYWPLELLEKQKTNSDESWVQSSTPRSNSLKILNIKRVLVSKAESNIPKLVFNNQKVKVIKNISTPSNVAHASTNGKVNFLQSSPNQQLPIVSKLVGKNIRIQQPSSLIKVHTTANVFPNQVLVKSTNAATSLPDKNCNIGASSSLPSNRKQNDNHDPQTNEIIDLLSPPSSPGLQHTTSVHKTFTVNKNSGSNVRIHQLQEYETTSTKPPYRVESLCFKSKLVSTINVRPYKYSLLAITLFDLRRIYFSKMETKTLTEAITTALKCDLYRPNLTQKLILREKFNGLTNEDDFYLITVPDFDKFYQHLTFIHSRHQESEQESSGEAKRPKISQDKAVPSSLIKSQIISKPQNSVNRTISAPHTNQKLLTRSSKNSRVNSSRDLDNPE